MKTWFTPFLLTALILSLSANAADLIINNVTLLSSDRQQPLSPAYVAIKDDTIVQVSTKPIKAKNAKVLDATGQFLMPGITDSHVHLRVMPGIIENPDIPARLAPLQAAFLRQQPRSYLYFGVTQLLDLNSSSSNLSAIKSLPLVPDIFHCGAIGMVGAYGIMGLTPKEAIERRNYVLFDKEAGLEAPEGVDYQDHSAETLVKRIQEDGARCVKIYFEDGFGEASHWPLMPDSIVERIRNEAKKYNLPLFAHANAIDMQALAMKSGVDVLAHGLWNWNKDDGAQTIPANIAKLIDMMVEKNVTYQSTFNVMQGLAGVMSEQVLHDQAYLAAVPSNIVDWYKTDEAKWFQRVLVNDFDGLAPKFIEKAFRRKLSQNARVIKSLYDKGHPIVVASDTPSSPTYAAQPGYSTYREMQQMYDAGIALTSIFDAATINNAKLLNIDDRFGTVEPGKKANLLLLKKNPLETIDAYNSIEHVILSGKAIQRESLRAD